MESTGNINLNQDFLSQSLVGHKVSVALIHWPVLNKRGDIVATNVTNFDVHDIARVCRSYGVRKYFIVNRVKEQLMFVSRMIDHWKVGEGSVLNPMRQTALTMIELEPLLEDVISNHFKGLKPIIYATAARSLKSLPVLSFREIRENLRAEPEREVLIIFGTGFGLDEQILAECDGLIEPIKGASEDDYRHLSVRSAASICLDRILGAW